MIKSAEKVFEFYSFQLYIHDFLPFLFSGQASAYVFDEATGGLVLSHKYVLPKKDHPGTWIIWVFHEME